MKMKWRSVLKPQWRSHKDFVGISHKESDWRKRLERTTSIAVHCTRSTTSRRWSSRTTSKLGFFGSVLLGWAGLGRQRRSKFVVLESLFPPTQKDICNCNQLYVYIIISCIKPTCRIAPCSTCRSVLTFTNWIYIIDMEARNRFIRIIQGVAHLLAWMQQQEVILQMGLV